MCNVILQWRHKNKSTPQVDKVRYKRTVRVILTCRVQWSKLQRRRLLDAVPLPFLTHISHLSNSLTISFTNRNGHTKIAIETVSLAHWWAIEYYCSTYIPHYCIYQAYTQLLHEMNGNTQTHIQGQTEYTYIREGTSRQTQTDSRDNIFALFYK